MRRRGPPCRRASPRCIYEREWLLAHGRGRCRARLRDPPARPPVGSIGKLPLRRRRSVSLRESRASIRRRASGRAAFHTGRSRREFAFAVAVTSDANSGRDWFGPRSTTQVRLACCGWTLRRPCRRAAWTSTAWQQREHRTPFSTPIGRPKVAKLSIFASSAAAGGHCPPTASAALDPSGCRSSTSLVGLTLTGP